MLGERKVAFGDDVAFCALQIFDLISKIIIEPLDGVRHRVGISAFDLLQRAQRGSDPSRVRFEPPRLEVGSIKFATYDPVQLLKVCRRGVEVGEGAGQLPELLMSLG